MEDHQANPRDEAWPRFCSTPRSRDERSSPSSTSLARWCAFSSRAARGVGSDGRPAVWHLAKNPSELARLVHEPLIHQPEAVEEFLRFYAPVTMARLVKEDMEYLGKP